MRKRAGGVLAALVMALLPACGGSAPEATAPPDAIEASTVNVIVATTVLRPGEQRFAFILESTTGIVNAPSVSVTARQDGSDAPAAAEATFHQWPFGTRGAYVTTMAFEAPGSWLVSVEGETLEGAVEFSVDVAEGSPVRDVGERVPFSNTKTAAGGDLSTITSDPRPDPGLYITTIAEAVFSGKPSVVVFASPAFCTSPTCGPQVDTVVELKDAHAGEANFIHVEVYANPGEIQGDLSRGVLSPHLAEWGISEIPGYNNESWVFVLGADGRITHRFEGYATFGELEAALLEDLAV